mgnify:CR=1 FL=1
MRGLHEADALDFVRGLPDACVDAVITDPPYASTGDAASIMRTSAGAFSVPRETQFYEAWLREQLREWVRVLRPTGVVWMTIDWRGAMALDTACARLGLRSPKVGVWDRGGLGMGYALRSTYECFAVVAMPRWSPLRHDVPDVWRAKWTPSHRKHGHSAEKPVELFRIAIETFTSANSVVLDPFAGSGTTGVACAITSREFVGVERDDRFALVARKRIEAAFAEAQNGR